MKELEPGLHPRRLAELNKAHDELFGKISDAIRDAALMATGTYDKRFFDLLPSVNGGDSYGSQAHHCTRVASVGSCHDALASGEGCEQANKANPASFIFTAPT